MGDKELLLNVEKTDSEVEEFKLPPPRTRRTRTRKVVSEARVIKSESPLITVKCIFTFIVVSIVLSGLLLLGFYIMTMQSSISDLRNELKENKNNAGQTSDLVKRIDQLEKELHNVKKNHSNNILLLTSQNKRIDKELKHLNYTVEMSKPNPSVLLLHRIQLLENDLNDIKRGLAHTGGDIDKLEDKITTDQTAISLLQNAVKKIKEEHVNQKPHPENHHAIAMNTSDYVNNKSVYSFINNFTDSFVKKEEIETKLSDLLESISKKEKTNSDMLLLEVTNLKTIADSLNISHNRDLKRLTHDISTLKNQSIDIMKQITINTVTGNSDDSGRFTSLVNTFKVHKQEIERHEKSINKLTEGLKDLNKTVYDELLLLATIKTDSSNKTRNTDVHRLLVESAGLTHFNTTNQSTPISVEDKIKTEWITATSVSTAPLQSIETAAIKTSIVDNIQTTDQTPTASISFINNVIQTNQAGPTVASNTTKSIILESTTFTPMFNLKSTTIDNSPVIQSEELKSNTSPPPISMPSTSEPDAAGVTGNKYTLTNESKTEQIFTPMGPMLPHENGVSRELLQPENIGGNLNTEEDVFVAKEKLQSPVFEQKTSNKSEKDFSSFEMVNTNNTPIDSTT